MDRVQAIKMFILLLKIIAICIVGWLGQSVPALTIAAIILLQLPKRVSLGRDVCEVFVIAAIMLMTFLYPNLSNTFFIALLALYTLVTLINIEKTSDLALGSTLVALVGFCSIALNIIPSEVASSHLLIWPLFLFAAIASLSEKSVMLLGVIVVIALALDIERSLITYTVLAAYAIELVSLQKQKALQTAVLLGLVVSPFHLWLLVALALLCIANQFKQSAETLRSFAALLSLFSCLINATNLLLIIIIFIGLLFILFDNKRLERLC